MHMPSSTHTTQILRQMLTQDIHTNIHPQTHRRTHLTPLFLELLHYTFTKNFFKFMQNIASRVLFTIEPKLR